jgi:hypothetical protein
LLANQTMHVTSPTAGSEGYDNTLDGNEKNEYDILAAMNLCRTKPKEFAVQLENMIPHFRDKIFFFPDGSTPTMTSEGVSAVVEAVAFFKQHEPVQALSYSKGMSLAARDHIEDTGSKGTLGHIGTDGSDPSKRLYRHGDWYNATAESVSYGISNALYIAMQLVIDDGVPSRGHRANMMNSQFTLCGVAFGHHKSYNCMCVIEYAAFFRENSEPNPFKIQQGVAPILEL